ncbi:MAG: UDP-3-O-acyl-N-acetylglucosamine deacetylase [bacterium]
MLKEGRYQHTLEKTVEFSGIALHSGKKIQIKFKPATADTGIVFKRVDLPDKPEVKAEPFSVVSTNRCTGIGKDNGGYKLEILTVEHIMAAIWSLNLDNIIIEVNGPEIPIADGSAFPFYKALLAGGVKKLSRRKKVIVIEKPLWIRDDDCYMVVLPYQGFMVDYTLHYNHPVVGTQFFQFDADQDDFKEEIAKARTFGFKKEIKNLHQQDLIQGGSLENAILIDEKSVINSLRYSDELVRHKILDIIGDMSLNGDILGHVVSVKSGHSLHIKMAKKIKEKFI